MSFVVFSCRNCGAGVEAPPDNLLLVCSYCGDRYPSKEMGDMPVSLIPTVRKEQIIEAVHKRMAADAQMKGKEIHINTAEGVYIPIFITKTGLRGFWKGYKKVKSGKTTRKVWNEGTIDSTGDFPIVGRKHAYEFGMTSIGQVLFDQKSVAFEDVDWSTVRLPVLSVDIDESNVNIAIQDDALDFLSAQLCATKNISTITEFDIDVDMHDRCLVMFPFWTVTYQYQGGSYRVAVSGGDMQVLAAMEPIFLASRIWIWCKGVGGILGAGIVCEFMLWLGSSDSDNKLQGILVLLFGIAYCAYIAWGTAAHITKSIQVESIGKSEEHVS